jgi:hypothetical protein
MQRLRDTVNILVPTGAPGIGVNETEVAAGLAAGAHAIACDAGSTDSGPAYLATGTPVQGDAMEVAEAAVYRTARRLIDGRVYVPASRLR